MAQNTFKTPAKAARARRVRVNPIPVAGWLRTALGNSGLDRLFGANTAWPLKHIERILWVSALLLLYIASNHNAERLIRNSQRAKAQRDELRAEFTTLQSEFMKSGKQSELSKRVLADSLLDSQSPPYKIVVNTHPDGQ